jgi:hypothetical protein
MSEPSSPAGSGSRNDPMPVDSDAESDGGGQTSAPPQHNSAAGSGRSGQDGNTSDGHGSFILDAGGSQGNIVLTVQSPIDPGNNQATAPGSLLVTLQGSNQRQTFVVVHPDGVLTLVATNNGNGTVTVTATGTQTGVTATQTIRAKGKGKQVSAGKGKQKKKKNKKKKGRKPLDEKDGVETFEDHPTDPNLMISRYRAKIPGDPNGAYYEQVDVLPREIPDAVSDGETVFYPKLDTGKVKDKIRASKKNGGNPPTWTKKPDGPGWTRPSRNGGEDEYWEPIMFYRQFDSVTLEYLYSHHNVGLLENVDPNDPVWKNKYHKWIDQMKRRRDSKYVQKMNKDHWTPAERRALYSAVNSFIRTSGMHNFGFGNRATASTSTADLQVIADAVNKVGGKNRLVDAVRGQIASSHPTKNKAILKLLGLAQALRDKLDREEKVTREELFLREAIPRSSFPSDPAAPKKTRGKGKKVQEDVGVEKKDYNALVATNFKKHNQMDAEEDTELSDASSELESDEDDEDGSELSDAPSEVDLYDSDDEEQYPDEQEAIRLSVQEAEQPGTKRKRKSDPDDDEEDNDKDNEGPNSVGIAIGNDSDSDSSDDDAVPPTAPVAPAASRSSPSNKRRKE